MTSFLRRLAGADIALGAAFLAGELPQGRIGIGPAAVGATRVPPTRNPSLTLVEVDRTFALIKEASGAGAAGERHHLLCTLMGRATSREQRFLSRLIVGELRQGALEGLMVEAVARATGIVPSDLRRAVMLTGATPVVAHAALTAGASGLARFALRLVEPVKQMLAQTTDSVDEALCQLGRAGLEYKLDGVRVQIHKAGSRVRVFTRRGHEVSESVPDIVEIAQRLPAEEAILDGEALATRSDGRPHSFQTTMRRFARKLDLAELCTSLPLSALFFDCLQLNGESLIDQPGRRRFAALREAAPTDLLIPRLETSRVMDAEHFLQEALSRGHEGIMAKSLDAEYQAGQRGGAWLKLKPVHVLDLVIVAAEWGHGRRRGWLSNLHLAAYDPATETFAMLGKTFKGLTDETLAWQTRQLLRREIARDDTTVYVRPELVVAVAFNDVQASPQYPAEMALRFARIRGYRPDKGARQADTIATVRRIREKRVSPRAAQR